MTNDQLITLAACTLLGAPSASPARIKAAVETAIEVSSAVATQSFVAPTEVGDGPAQPESLAQRRQ